MKEFILLTSFLLVTGLVGAVENGDSICQLLWCVPIILADALVIYNDEKEHN